MTRFLPIILLLNFFIISCENGLQGNLKENIPPNTSLTVNEINLPEGERLVSQVNISWWGDDPDGFIVGYEFYIGDATTVSDDEWVFTNKTDSTFILPIPAGSMDADVKFNIRAVDDDDARDEEPASLIFPIRNTRPKVEFIFNHLPPDTTFRIASFGFIPSDPDGRSNLNRLEIALNDTSTEDSWVEIPLEANLVTLSIDDTSAVPSAEALLGQSATSFDLFLEDVNLNEENTFYIRAFDNAAAVSEVLTYTWFVKKQTSRILFLNDYAGFSSQETAKFHLNLLDSIGINKVDLINISDGEALGGTRVSLSRAFHDRTLAEPTINLMFSQWDYIYWISNDLNRNIGYALELTQEFFDQGGKMFINIPIEYLSDRNSLFQFLPFQAVQLEPDLPGRSPTFRIQSCTEVTSTSDISYDPNLRFKNIISPANPIVPFSTSISFFETEFTMTLRNPTERVPYEGSSIVSAIDTDQDIFYFGFDLTDFTTVVDNPCEDSFGNPLPPSDLEGLLDFILIETLGFEK